MKRWIAVLLTIVLCLGLCACGETGGSGKKSSGASDAEKEISAEAKACAELIEAIGEVSLDSEEAIKKAEEAYAKLADDDKKEISDDAAALETARKTFDGLVKQAKVDNVIALIDVFANSTITVDSEDAINAAEDAYNALSEEEQKMVTNYSKLELAKTALGVAQMAEQEKIKAEKEKVIKEYSKKFNINTDKVKGITWYNPKNRPQYIDIRSYIIPYIGIRSTGAPWICIRYNYTGDDWIFWESLTIVTDNNRYTKTYSYSSIHRDNGGGDVWENYDEVLPTGASMDSNNIQMLKDIAESDETIIRFQGDYYYYDLYVTKEDKTMIKDVLKLYEAMLP